MTAGGEGHGHLLVLSGLPGTGKSTLARALAADLRAALLDKDRVREALFGPDGVEYSGAQDDHCCEVCYATAIWILKHTPRRLVLLDGRTYSRSAQVERVIQLAREATLGLVWIECVCPPDEARARLEADLRAGAHPAANRGPGLYDEIAARAEPLPTERLVLDTHLLTPEEQVARCRDYLRSNQAWTE